MGKGGERGKERRGNWPKGKGGGKRKGKVAIKGRRKGRIGGNGKGLKLKTMQTMH